MRRSLLSTATAAALTFVASNAIAQGGGGNLAAAEDYFRQATTAMEAKDYAKACPLFAESMRQDPQIGTLLNVARCHELQGKTASAWGEYHDVIARAEKAGQSERVKFAREAAARLDTQLIRVTFDVSAPTNGEVITLDKSIEIGRAAWGTPIAVDPGEHRLDARAPGKKELTVKFEATSRPGGQPPAQVNVPMLEDAEEQRARPPPPPPNGGDASSTASSSGRRTVGFALLGAGAVGVLAGTIAGIAYLGKRDDYNTCKKFGGDDANTAQPCADPKAPSDAGAAAKYDDDQRSSANTMGIVSTIAFGVGLVGLGAGAYLVVTSPAKSATATQLRFIPRFGGASITGTF